jgi:hypothetical protein
MVSLDVDEFTQRVEKPPWCPLSPEIGHQTHRFWGSWSLICGRDQLDADFFNTLSTFHALG